MATGPELHPGRTYRFGPFELSERDGELRKNGIRIKLQDQPFRVLLELLGSAGQVVTREELQQKLWPADTFVDFDVGLNTAIRKLRQALGDDADAPRYIETLARRGYRFVAPLSSAEPQAAPIAHEIPAPETPPAPKLEIEPASRGNHRAQYLVAAASAIVLAVLAVFALRYASTVTPRLIVEKRITDNPEEAPIIAAVVSPDGKYVAYTDPTGAYFRQIDTGEVHVLPVPPGGGWIPTSWYPDSTHLLVSAHTFIFGPERLSPERYSSGVATRVWKVSILGGAPQPVIDDATLGVVSPDGSRIAFYRRGDGFEPRELWIASNEGSDLQQVFVPAGEHTFISQVAWSPHGRRVAYVRLERPDRELWAIETMDVTTHAVRTLKVSGRFAAALSWGPDGRLFYGYQPENKGERLGSVIYAVPVNEDTGAPAGPETQLTDGSGVVSGMSITRDGKRIVIWRDSFLPQAFVTEFDDSGQKLQPLRRLTFDQNSNLVTAWTPDSRAVIFSSNRSGTFHLYRQAIDETVAETVVENERIVLARRSPDDKYYVGIVDTDLQHKEPLGIVLLPVEGGPARMVLRHPGISDVQCARAPSSLCLLLTVGPGEKIYSLRLEDGALQDFPIPVKEDFRQWGLSPDGSVIGLVINGPKLVFVETASKRVHEFKVGDWAELIALDWTADSKAVFMASRKPDGSSVLLRIERDGTWKVVLEGGKVPRVEWAIPAPDGEHVAVMAFTGENNAWMIENF